MDEYLVAGSTLGVFPPYDPNVLSTDIKRPSTGPNLGLAFLINPITVNTYEVAVYPGLEPPSVTTPLRSANWYNDQNGRGSGTCLPANVATLLANVDRHEGTTMATNSHFGVANAQFAALRPDMLLEKLVTRRSDNDLIGLVTAAFTKFITVGPYKAAQKQFDRTDTPIVNAIGCKLDLNENDQ